MLIQFESVEGYLFLSSIWKKNPVTVFVKKYVLKFKLANMGQLMRFFCSTNALAGSLAQKTFPVELRKLILSY